MENDQKIKLEDTQKNQNGRQLKDDQNILKMEDNQNIFQNGRGQNNQNERQPKEFDLQKFKMQQQQ